MSTDKNCNNTAAEYLREDKNALSRNSKENMKTYHIIYGDAALWKIKDACVTDEDKYQNPGISVHIHNLLYR